MTDVIRLETPLTQDKVAMLKAGDNVLLSGIVYTARDAAHKKMVEALGRGEALPFDVKDQIIYFVGPAPAKEGQVIGSAGPTTSGRMDAYSPIMIGQGLTGMIGKGLRSEEVIEAMQEHGAVYFGAIGGAGALIAKRIVASEVIAYPELGPEAVRRIEVKDFPAIVIIDSQGNNLYETGKAKYRQA
ncbi:MAG TPA: Fe-S-containing hydro-lyase [Desulfosporosinus sp.]|nr:Fe-S-containing hydro-lyase [Desulfosporosinus sp.]